jgi:hypothetical protein
MNIITYSLKQSPSIQDKNTLSGQMFTNFFQITPFLTAFYSIIGIDERLLSLTNTCESGSTVVGQGHQIVSQCHATVDTSKNHCWSGTTSVIHTSVINIISKFNFKK